MIKRIILNYLILLNILVFSSYSLAVSLSFDASYHNAINGIEGIKGANTLTVSPDGKQLYVIGFKEHSIAVFTRNSQTGKLTFLEFHKDGVDGVDGLRGPVAVVVSPDGKQVYVAGDYADAVTVFNRDRATGALTFFEVYKNGVQGIEGLDGPKDVAISPDGEQVYVTGGVDNALVIFNRNATTGRLTFFEMHQGVRNGGDGLQGLSGITVSADGKYIYVTGYDDDSLVSFSRDKTTGELSIIDIVFNDSNDITGLDGPKSLVVSPDGNQVYVIGFLSDAVVLFRRDTETGLLSYYRTYVNGSSQYGKKIDGLYGAMDIVVSLDGKEVYVVGFHDDTLAVFKRSNTKGELSYIEVYRDNYEIESLDGAFGVAISPDGKQVYVAGNLSSDLVVFNRTDSDVDIVFDWAERKFSDSFSPVNQPSYQFGKWYYRSYSIINSVIALNTSDGDIYVYSPQWGLVNVDSSGNLLTRVKETSSD
ncbi:MAG: beta-propeller fold lactonase family protein [Pseudomonadota bacterium]